MVLAAGLGVRMRPLTLERPKPLLEVAGCTLLDHALDRLDAAGVTRAVVNTHYLGEQIVAHLAQRTRPEIRISQESVALETGGGIRRALPVLGERPFFVVNADILWVDGPIPALSRLAGHWDDGAMDALLLMMPIARATGFDGPGDYLMDEYGRLRRRRPDEVAPFVFAGVHIAHPRLFRDTPPETPFSNNQVWDRAEAEGRLFGIVHDGTWYHIGTPDALAETRSQLEPAATRAPSPLLF